VTREELVGQVALAFAKRINPNSTRGNSMDTEYAELALDTIESSGANILVPTKARDLDGSEHVYTLTWLTSIDTDLGPSWQSHFPSGWIKDSPALIYVPLESAQ
jgi:hypothetical protein